MRVDGGAENESEVERALRFLYEAAAVQRANADIGIAFTCIRLSSESPMLTVKRVGYGAVDIPVTYSAWHRDSLREVLLAKGIPAKPAPPDDGTMGIPSSRDSSLHKHAWILKQIAYGVDPWTVYGRTWSGELLRVELSSHHYTDAVFRLDGYRPALRVSIFHDDYLDGAIGLNYALVDQISTHIDSWRQRRIFVKDETELNEVTILK
ncbi:hypothetical protein AB0M95_40400 [Sphaerisporangium sp. NPDC051017]|uniref:hypothetical protein n=1 Tax=Sphaerisporangium sp. NPDC051017 TaxID=3154636 RepID=UPI0034171951